MTDEFRRWGFPAAERLVKKARPRLQVEAKDERAGEPKDKNAGAR